MKKTNNNGGSALPVVLFDFDGTLSKGDTNVYFWRYCFRHSLRPWFFLPVILCGCIVRLIAYIRPGGGYSVRKIDMLWRQMFRIYLTPKMLKKFAPPFIREHMKNHWGWSAEQVAKERAAGNTVIMVSATADYLLMPLLDGMEFDLIICSEMEPAYPWKYRFLNWGQNKAAALKSVLSTYRVVRAYSDSRSDRPMMDMAAEQVWINPETGCRISAP